MAKIKKEAKKKEIVSFSMDENMKKRLSALSEETDINRSGLIRIAVADFLENRCNEPAFMLYFIELVQQVNDIQGMIHDENYKRMQQNIGNMMKIKGGQ